MRAHRRRHSPGKPTLALRGLCATAAGIVVAALLVGRATGHLDPLDDVYVDVPVAAGLISTDAPVRYHGVNVGHIAEIRSGTTASTVRLAIERASLDLIPNSVVVRVVPRTFFGDIYLQLADRPGPRPATGLAPGADRRRPRNPHHRRRVGRGTAASRHHRASASVRRASPGGR